jgi:hypothetical protein
MFLHYSHGIVTDKQRGVEEKEHQSSTVQHNLKAVDLAKLKLDEMSLVYVDTP